MTSYLQLLTYYNLHILKKQEGKCRKSPAAIGCGGQMVFVKNYFQGKLIMPMM